MKTLLSNLNPSFKHLIYQWRVNETEKMDQRDSKDMNKTDPIFIWHNIWEKHFLYSQPRFFWTLKGPQERVHKTRSSWKPKFTIYKFLGPEQVILENFAFKSILLNIRKFNHIYLSQIVLYRYFFIFYHKLLWYKPMQ